MIDRKVMELAVEQGRVLVTFDRDYGELIFRKRLPPPPAVFLLRVRSYRPEDPAKWVARLVLESQVWPDHFTVFDGRTIRRRQMLR